MDGLEHTYKANWHQVKPSPGVVLKSGLNSSDSHNPSKNFDMMHLAIGAFRSFCLGVELRQLSLIEKHDINCCDSAKPS